jgi:predicted O-methyltransferase YrrM
MTADLTLERLAERVNAIEPARRFDPFTRKLVRDELFLLHDQWRSLLGIEWLDKSHIRYIHYRLINIEQQCVGRLAGDIQDAVLRMMIALAAGERDGGVRALEIGTLFGINAAAMWDIGTSYHKSAILTIIDPLDGYYGTSRRDVATGLRICQSTVERNLSRVGVPPNEVRLIAALSESTEAIRTATRATYNCAFIDGDHTYEGIMHDWHNYAPAIEPGGYVIFDNCHDTSWPQVQRAVDEIRSDTSVEYVGSQWRTCVFRKR